MNSPRKVDIQDSHNHPEFYDTHTLQVAAVLVHVGHKVVGFQPGSKSNRVSFRFRTDSVVEHDGEDHTLDRTILDYTNGDLFVEARGLFDSYSQIMNLTRSNRTNG